MMEEDTEQPWLGIDRNGFGPAPFDETSTGDCILQTSDGVKYKAHRIVLALASSVFRDMWEIGTDDRDVPVVELTELSDVVHTLLLHLYPTMTPAIDTFTLALNLMDACEKYLIDTNSLLPFLANIFKCRTSGDMLDAYCLAWRLNMRKHAQESSEYLHELDLTRPGVLQEIDRKAGDVKAFISLLDLRYRREVALDSFLERLPLGLYKCPEHLRLSLREMGQLRQNVRKAFRNPWFSSRRNISDFLDLFDEPDVPSETSHPANVHRIDERDRRSSSIGGPRTKNPPCPACQATLKESRRN